MFTAKAGVDRLHERQNDRECREEHQASNNSIIDILYRKIRIYNDNILLANSDTPIHEINANRMLPTFPHVHPWFILLPRLAHRVFELWPLVTCCYFIEHSLRLHTLSILLSLLYPKTQLVTVAALSKMAYNMPIRSAAQGSLDHPICHCE